MVSVAQHTIIFLKYTKSSNAVKRLKTSMLILLICLLVVQASTSVEEDTETSVSFDDISISTCAQEALMEAKASAR